MGVVFNIPGFEGRTLAIKGGLWTGSKLCVNGVRIPREEGKYLLRDNSGNVVEIKLKYDLGNLIDGVPHVELAGDKIRIVPPLTTMQFIWTILPMAMLFIGGILGGFLGAIATTLNARVFRLKWHPVIKYLLTGLVSLVPFIIWLVIGIVLHFRYNI